MIAKISTLCARVVCVDPCSKYFPSNEGQKYLLADKHDVFTVFCVTFFKPIEVPHPDDVIGVMVFRLLKRRLKIGDGLDTKLQNLFSNQE